MSIGVWCATLNEWSQLWAPLMLRACWAGAFATGLVWLVCRAAGSYLPVAWRPWLWRLALLRMLLAVLPASVPLHLPALLRPAPADVAAPRQSALLANALPSPEIAPRLRRAPSPSARRDTSSSKRIPEVQSQGAIEVQTPPSAASVKTSDKEPHRDEPQSGTLRLRLNSVLLLLWVAGVSVVWTRIGQQWMRARALRRDSSRLHAPQVVEMCAGLCAQLNVKRPPALRGTSRGGPVLIGAFRPAILLPQTLLDECSSAELRLILSHELAHLKRRDLAWKGLLVAVMSVFFFHPALWLLRREWEAADETACDALALQTTGEPIAVYGRLLLRVASSAPNGLNWSTIGVTDGFKTLERRLKAMQMISRSNRVVAATLAAATLIALLPWRVVAQNEPVVATPSAATPTPTAAAPKAVEGRVTKSGVPVSGATVYLMPIFRTGAQPLATSATDADGRFRLSGFALPGHGKWQWSQVLVDAGARGFWFADVDLNQAAKPVVLRMPPVATLQLSFKHNGRPAPNLDVRLAQMNRSSSYWLSLPPSILKRLRKRTDARGQVSFAGLPQGLIAQPMLSDEKYGTSRLGYGDKRGGRFAPLSIEDFVPLQHAMERKTIELLDLVTVDGSVKFGPTGLPVANSRVLARRITAQEDAGGKENIDRVIASTQTNARGRYQLRGLRPGKYVLWTWPNGKLRRDWTSINPERYLKTGQPNRVDFQLFKGAIIEGRVVSAVTGKPVFGQYMGVFDAEENYKYEVSKMDGSFRFRVPGGKQHLWVHANAASPPAGYVLPAKNTWDFTLQNDHVYRIEVRLPGAPLRAPARAITGHVLGPDGQPVANTQIGSDSFGDEWSHKKLRNTDAAGRFMIDAEMVKRPMRLWAKQGELQTSQSTIALGGDDVTLRLQANAGVTISGRVVDGSNKPIADARVRLSTLSGNVAWKSGSVVTGADGSFTFVGQRPRVAYWISVERKRFKAEYYDVAPPQPGKTIEKTVQMQRADSFVAGRIFGSDGKPASGLQVYATGADTSVLSDKTGHFRLTNIVPGAISIVVSARDSASSWPPVRAVAGRSDVVIKLPKQTNQAQIARLRASFIERLKLREVPSGLIGSVAPEIAATAWANSEPLSLRGLKGKIVLLDFWSGEFPGGRGVEPAVQDIATQFSGRGVQVIGMHFAPTKFVRSKSGRMTIAPAASSRFTVNAYLLRHWATQLHLDYPLALDASSTGAQGLGAGQIPGETLRRYGGANRVVIDREGRVVYAGESLSDAMNAIAALLAIETP